MISITAPTDGLTLFWPASSNAAVVGGQMFCGDKHVTGICDLIIYLRKYTQSESDEWIPGAIPLDAKKSSAAFLHP